MRSTALKLAASGALACGALAAVGMGAVAQTGTAPPTETRESYVLRALADLHPPGVKGLRHTGTGTGFFIGPDKILTNFHVVDSCTALTVGNNREGAEIDAKLLAGDAALDLAVLSAQAEGIAPARFQLAVAPDALATLAIVGYPNHGLPVLNAELNRVAAFEDDFTSARRLYRFAGEARRGNSGGPVLDLKGDVVGVVTATIDTVNVYRRTGLLVDDIGFAISNRTVLDFLRAQGIDYQTAADAPRLSADQILPHERGFVRQIGCWKRPAKQIAR